MDVKGEMASAYSEEEMFVDGTSSQHDHHSEAGNAADFVELTLETQLQEGDDEAVHSDDGTLKFQIITSGTIRKSTLLIDSKGYTYTVKSKLGDSIIWQCSVRNKHMYCTAVVKQTGSKFTYGSKGHTHEPKPKTPLPTRKKRRSSKKMKAAAAQNTDSQHLPLPMIILHGRPSSDHVDTLDQLRQEVISPNASDPVGRRGLKYDETGHFQDQFETQHGSSEIPGTAAMDPLAMIPHLVWLESLIPKRRLQEFKRTTNDIWNGDMSALELFHVWKIASSANKQ